METGSLCGACHVIVQTAQIHCEDVFGIVGENFTFPVKIDQKIGEIIWTKNKDKVAEWEGQKEPTYLTSLRNKGLLNKENGCLTIFNLEFNDAGIYMLDYVDSGKRNHILNFVLTVLAPPPEPEINCNISGDDVVLKCTAHFQKPLNYSWKFTRMPFTYQTQEVFIPKKNVDGSEKASCFIKFSQTEKNSEISLAQCFPDNKGDRYHRNRSGLIPVPFLIVAVVLLVVFLYRRDRHKHGTRRSAGNSTGDCSGLPSCNSQDEGRRHSVEELLTSFHKSPRQLDCENEKPEADKELNEEDGALKDNQTVTNGVNQEDRSCLAKHADDHVVNEADLKL
ncbi:lymphocyte function-associated antigen 3 isoform X2 [Egretta garzetta]|uniref:lymphocyte function-associated antigen 3 isoform X2 n=1 Tax=Egretta garzetta TaxID=188379 RepID=UPI00163B9E24|nr:lymphocyte function-associated antigen 3 isoform X2 [Egretta garzetta]